MTLTKWRTTKIPAFYFSEIENILSSSERYVSISEFIRKAIEEKIESDKSSRNFLLIKDLIFTESKIIHIHDLICEKFDNDSKDVLKPDFQRVIDESLDVDLFTFLSKFVINFAKFHPFEDANKRTLLVSVDAFLRLNNFKLNLRADKKKETKDEIFFWQNSAQQRTYAEAKEFLARRAERYNSTSSVEREIDNSINENMLLLEKLSQ